jgi:hypothetical protein
LKLCGLSSKDNIINIYAYCDAILDKIALNKYTVINNKLLEVLFNQSFTYLMVPITGRLFYSIKPLFNIVDPSSPLGLFGIKISIWPFKSWRCIAVYFFFNVTIQEGCFNINIFVIKVVLGDKYKY